MKHLEVDLEPIDPLLFGDSRSARAGADHARRRQGLSPATLFGAIGAQIIRKLGVAGEADWEPKAGDVLGPFSPGLRNPSNGDDRAELVGHAWRDLSGRLWFPCPRHFLLQKPLQRFFPAGILQPQEIEGASDSTDFPRLAVPNWEDEEAKRAEWTELTLVDETLLASVLSGDGDVLRIDLTDRVIEPRSLETPENRIGIVIDNYRQATVEGRLFNRPLQRFLEGMPADSNSWKRAGFRAWYHVLRVQPEQLADWGGLGFFGGDRRRVRFTFSEQIGERPLQAVLDRVLEAAETAKGFLAYLLTPAVAEDGLSLEGQCVAAAIGKPEYVSGWRSVAQRPGPRPMRTLYPAGSVFFCKWNEDVSSKESRSQFITRRWLGSVSPSHGRCGFGRILVGVWK